MSLIEGVGDEVTVCLVVVLILLVLALAWFSTNVSDRSTVNVIVIDRRSFQRLLQRISNLTGRSFQARLLTGTNGNNNGASSDAPINGSSVDPPDGVDDGTGVQDVSGVQQEAESSSVENASTSFNPESVDEPSVVSSDNTQVTPSPSPLSDGTPSDRELNNEASASPEPPLESEILDQELLRKTRLAFFEKLSNKERSPEPEVSETVTSEAPPTEEAQNVENIAERNSENGGESSSNQEPTSSNNQNGTEEQERLDGHIRIRLKYLNDRQRLVQAKPEDTIGEFKRRHFEAELAENLLVRCIFNGQELRPDSTTLQSYNISDQSIIHCLSQARPAPEQNNTLEQEEWDIGTFMFPLFGLILVLTWYCRFTYRQYFNAMSTFSLIGITLLYVVAILATWRTQEQVHPHQE